MLRLDAPDVTRIRQHRSLIPPDVKIIRKIGIIIDDFFLVPLSANLRDSMASNFAFSVVVCL